MRYHRDGKEPVGSGAAALSVQCSDYNATTPDGFIGGCFKGERERRGAVYGVCVCVCVAAFFFQTGLAVSARARV